MKTVHPAARDLLLLAIDNGWSASLVVNEDTSGSPYVTVTAKRDAAPRKVIVTWHTRSTGTYRLFSSMVEQRDVSLTKARAALTARPAGARPRLLDAFCCEGGASMGYHRAGFDVFGVDLFRHRGPDGKWQGHDQRKYPFPSHKGDAIEYIKAHGHEFDAIAASPPCQARSAGTRALDRSGYEQLIPATREAILATGRPYVLENVEGARDLLINPLMLCGSMFGLTAVDDDGETLRLERHRLFESDITLWPPFTEYHPSSVRVGGSYGGARKDKHEARNERHGGYVPSIPVQQQLLGIDWMTQKGMHQAIPPAYTEWIGRQLIDHLATLQASA